MASAMGYDASAMQAHFTIKSNDDLCALDPAPDTNPFTTEFTVTATDSDGASASRDIVATTTWNPDNCQPAFESAVVDGGTLTLTFDKALDAASVPAAGAFTVTVADNPRTVSAVAVSGSKVVLTLSSAVGEGETVTVSYAKPSANPLRGADAPRLPADGFSGKTVTNATGETPELEDAVVFRTKLTLYYDEDLDTGSVPAGTDFTVTVAGDAWNVSAVAVEDNRVTLTLAKPTAGPPQEVVRDQAVTIGYAAGTNPIRDTATPTPYEAAGFSGKTVRNLGADATAPRLRSATVEGNVLTLTYDELLDPDSVPPAAVFHVTAGDSNSMPRNVVTGVAVRDHRVVLTLTTAVDASHTPGRRKTNARRRQKAEKPEKGLVADFRKKVLGHASRTGLSDSRFGVMATGDPSLVRRLRRGGAPRLGTVDRVLAFLGEAPMAPAFLLEVEAFVAVTRTKESVFSRESSGNQSFLTQLRRGALPRLDTADRVRAWMRANCTAGEWEEIRARVAAGLQEPPTGEEK